MWKMIFGYIEPYIKNLVPEIIAPILERKLEELKSELRKNEFEFSSKNEGEFKAKGFLQAVDSLSQENRSLTELIPALRIAYPILTEQEASNVLKSCLETKKIKPNTDFSSFIECNSDWFNEFTKLSGKFSSEDAHKLWGSVLTAKLDNPNSISYRTMQAIANLTPDECFRFKSIFPYVIDGKYIFFLPSIRDGNKLNDLSELLFSLEDIGILKFVSAPVNLNIKTQKINGFEGVTFRAITKGITIYIGNRTSINNDLSRRINLLEPPSIRTIDLTKVGQEIFNVLRVYETVSEEEQIEYLNSIGRYIKNNMLGINVNYEIIDL